MRLWMIAISLGILLVSFLPVLPAPSITLVALPLVVTLALQRQQYFLLPVFILLGVLWAIHFGHGLLAARLPVALEGVNVWVQGVVIGLPVQSESRGEPVQRFDLLIDLPLCPMVDVLPAVCSKSVKRMRLNWYGQLALKPGQRWRLLVKAKIPHGTANPGGFDYQSWLVQQGVGAVGTVQRHAGNRLLDEQPYTIDRLRWDFSRYLDHTVSDLSSLPIIKALLIGDKRQISRRQWQLFAHTGITHLMVISGLHVGLIGALAFGLGRVLSALIVPGLAAERCGAVFAMCVAIAYSAAAGFSLPTQRALLMISVWMVCIFFRRHLAASQGLVVALLVCLLFDPLAPIGWSFWLSFAAVAVIFYGSTGRKRTNVVGDGGFFSRGFRYYFSQYCSYYLSQYLVFIGLIPVLAILLGKVSLLSPLINLFAVPLYSLIIVPLNLLAALLVWVSKDIGIGLWWCVDSLINYSLLTLTAAADFFTHAVLTIPQQPLTVRLLAVAGVLILLLPKGIPLRAMGLFLLLPLAWVKPAVPLPGDVTVTVLDVGQGLSVVVQTQHHVLVYDVGPAFNDEMSTASTVLIPYLQHRGIDKLDRLIISHGDNDHAGGWASLVERFPVTSLLYGEVLTGFDRPGFEPQPLPCKAGQHWQWDNVQFDILHPGQGKAESLYNSANNRSCVLKITTANYSFLLPGDIEQPVERQLAQRLTKQLAANVLIAPHHGSNSSSSWAFIKQVQPQHVVFASGYRNPFAHPRPEIIQRYQQMGSALHRSDRDGAITFQTINSKLLTVTHYRQQNRRYWR